MQLTWSGLGPGPVRFVAADTAVDVMADGGPGAVTLDHLPPASNVAVTVSGEGWPGRPRRLLARTLTSPPGAELYRMATVSDLHVGAAAFGYRNRMVDHAPDAADLHPMRCARAALAEAQAWGAERVVVKGDVTHDGSQTQWDLIGPILAEVTVPVDVVPGNHDRSIRRTVEPAAGLSRHGLTLVEGVRAIDLPGLRLVLADTCRGERHGGSVAAVADRICEVLACARTEGRPALLAVHHHFQSNDRRPLWPPGISAQEATRFLDRAADANPDLLVTSGHTHRHRRRRHGSVTLTQVGSTKDFPGVWAGYVVHEGGIRQVVRRVAEPSCMEWTERTGDEVFGLWRHIAPGRLGDRCFSLTWGV